MTTQSSDFPEFDRAYQSALIKDPADLFEQLAARANFNVYHSDIWRGTGRKFAELIVRECADVLKKDMELAHIQLIPLDFKMYANSRLQRTIKEHFGVEK